MTSAKDAGQLELSYDRGYYCLKTTSARKNCNHQRRIMNYWTTSELCDCADEPARVIRLGKFLWKLFVESKIRTQNTILGQFGAQK